MRSCLASVIPARMRGIRPKWRRRRQEFVCGRKFTPENAALPRQLLGGRDSIGGELAPQAGFEPRNRRLRPPTRTYSILM